MAAPRHASPSKSTGVVVPDGSAHSDAAGNVRVLSSLVACSHLGDTLGTRSPKATHETWHAGRHRNTTPTINSTPSPVSGFGLPHGRHGTPTPNAVQLRTSANYSGKWSFTDGTHAGPRWNPPHAFRSATSPVARQVMYARDKLGIRGLHPRRDDPEKTGAFYSLPSHGTLLRPHRFPHKTGDRARGRAQGSAWNRPFSGANSFNQDHGNASSIRFNNRRPGG